MREYFGEFGLRMMCGTASLQVCLDIGADDKDAARRWQLAHALGPVLRRLEDATCLANLAADRARQLLTGDQASQRPPLWPPPTPGPGGPYQHP
jgi:hypothetical protein